MKSENWVDCNAKEKREKESHKQIGRPKNKMQFTPSPLHITNHSKREWISETFKYETVKREANL